MAATNPDKAAQVARIEAIEAGTSDADTLLAAWRDAKTVQLNLRTRLRRAIAASPSLPPALAAEVVQTFPRELYDNPALPLLLLEAPTLLGLAPRKFWEHALASQDISPALMPALVAGCPHWFLGRLTRRPEFDAADAPALLARLCQTLTAEPAPSWALTDAQCLALCQRWYDPMLDVSDDVLAVLRAHPNDVRAQTLLARSTRVPLAEAEALLASYSNLRYLIERSFAARRDAPPARLELIARHSPGPTRAVVAANPQASPETLTWLAKDHQPDASAAALASPSLPRAVYEPLLKRGTARRRAVLATRPDLTRADFERLAAAGEAEVRIAVAQNPHAPPDLLARLAADLRDDVREALADNPAYTPETPSANLIEAPAAPLPTSKAARTPKPTLLERARPVLVGDMSGGPRWAEVLAWVEAGVGVRPKRVTMSAQDRKQLVRVGLKILGDDPAAYDAPTTRLLGAMVEALGSLPDLSATRYNKLGDAPLAERTALAEAWMARLMATGLSEAHALAALLDTRQAHRLGRKTSYGQRHLALLALGARLPRVMALLGAVREARGFERFVEDVGDVVAHLEAPTPTRMAAMVALYADARTRAHIDATRMALFARYGAVAFLDALEAHDPKLATRFLSTVNVPYEWVIPPAMLARIHMAQGKKPAV